MSARVYGSSTRRCLQPSSTAPSCPTAESNTQAVYAEGQDRAAPGKVLEVRFRLAGTPYTALNGGPHFILDEAVSIAVATRDQAETDRLWQALTADGGRESRCGWLTDRFGLSWQIVPSRATELLAGPHAARALARGDGNDKDRDCGARSGRHGAIGDASAASTAS